MTATVAGEGFPLSPGVMKFGSPGAEIDVSCNINSGTIAASKTQGDSKTKLCGTVKTGAVTYEETLSGNIDTDIGEATGFFAMTQENRGQEIDFTFTPNTVAGTTAVGVCILDPLDFGGGTTTETMTSDFEFTIVGEVVYTYGPGALAADSEDLAA